MTDIYRTTVRSMKVFGATLCLLQTLAAHAGQTETYNTSDGRISVDKLVKQDGRWGHFRFLMDAPANSPGFEAASCRILGSEARTMEDFVDSQLKAYEEVEPYDREKFSKLNSMGVGADLLLYTIKPKEDALGNLQMYSIKHTNRSNGAGTSFELNVVYDKTKDKILTLDDVFVPEMAAKIKADFGKDFINMHVSNFGIWCALANNGKGFDFKDHAYSYRTYEKYLTEDFKQSIGFSELSLHFAEKEEMVYDDIEVRPKLALEEKALKEFFDKSFHWPEELKKKDYKGEFLVGYVVEKDGSVSNVEITLSAEMDNTLAVLPLEKEMERVLNSMPHYTPACLYDIPVRASESLFFSFTQKGSSGIEYDLDTTFKRITHTNAFTYENNDYFIDRAAYAQETAPDTIFIDKLAMRDGKWTRFGCSMILPAQSKGLDAFWFWIMKNGAMLNDADSARTLNDYIDNQLKTCEVVEPYDYDRFQELNSKDGGVDMNLYEILPRGESLGNIQMYIFRCDNRYDGKKKIFELSVVYDKDKDKVLTVDDIFIPNTAWEIKRNFGNRFINMDVNASRVLCGGRAKRGKTVPHYRHTYTYAEQDSVLTEDFKQSIGFSAIAEKLAKEKEEKENKIYEKVHRMPYSDLSMKNNMKKFFNNNFHWPDELKKDNYIGRFLVSYIVEKDGSTSNVQMKDSTFANSPIEKEMERVIKLMPTYKPGRYEKDTVRTRMTLVFSFNPKSPSGIKYKKEIYNIIPDDDKIDWMPLLEGIGNAIRWATR